jgi:hypothetical protein
VPAESNSDALLRRLVDRQLIEDTLYRYASSIDRGDHDALRSTLADDAVGVYGDNPPLVGADAVMAWITERTAGQAWQHHLLNVYHVDIDGDVASALTYHTSHQATVADPSTVSIIVARYHDKLRRVDGDRWCITYKQMEILRRERRTAG